MNYQIGSVVFCNYECLYSNLKMTVTAVCEETSMVTCSGRKNKEPFIAEFRPDQLVSEREYRISDSVWKRAVVSDIPKLTPVGDSQHFKR
ncbi:hypothetical protein ACET62_10545 [Aeromonas veronii]